jgi:hypothetical protein
LAATILQTAFGSVPQKPLNVHTGPTVFSGDRSMYSLRAAGNPDNSRLHDPNVRVPPASAFVALVGHTATPAKKSGCHGIPGRGPGASEYC